MPPGIPVPILKKETGSGRRKWHDETTRLHSAQSGYRADQVGSSARQLSRSTGLLRVPIRASITSQSLVNPMRLSFARRIVRAFVVASLVAFIPRATHGQGVGPGDAVRITRAQSTFGGPLLSQDSASLVILRPVRGDTLRFLRTDITRAEVRRGSHRRGWTAVGKGALIGLGVGSVLGALALSDKSVSASQSQLKVVAALYCVVGGTGIGTALGGVASLQRVDSWVPFDPRLPSETSQLR